MSHTNFVAEANALKALAHPCRLEIVSLLSHGERSVTEMYEMLDLPQAQVSQHLMKLRAARVATCRREGKEIFYSLTNPAFVSLCQSARRAVSASQKILRSKKWTIDPVCHMKIQIANTSFSLHHKNQEFHFCASKCLAKFQNNPENYV